MKLNMDCIRDLLLAIEENTGYKKYMKIRETDFGCESLDNYSADDVMYHLNQLYLAGYIIVYGGSYDGGPAAIECLTPRGHEFIENIRNDGTWAKVKDSAFKVGSFALSVLEQIAKTIIVNKITG